MRTAASSQTERQTTQRRQLLAQHALELTNLVTESSAEANFETLQSAMLSEHQVALSELEKVHLSEAKVVDERKD